MGLFVLVDFIKIFDDEMLKWCSPGREEKISIKNEHYSSV